MTVTPGLIDIPVKTNHSEPRIRASMNPFEVTLMFKECAVSLLWPTRDRDHSGVRALSLRRHQFSCYGINGGQHRELGLCVPDSP